MTKRVEFIGTMKDSLTVTNEEGEEVPYFSPKFLIVKYLKMSEADLELNEKYKLEEKLAKKGQEEDEESGDDEELDNSEETPESDEGGEEDNGGDSIDDEMLGDVQPESPETTEA